MIKHINMSAMTQITFSLGEICKKSYIASGIPEYSPPTDSDYSGLPCEFHKSLQVSKLYGFSHVCKGLLACETLKGSRFTWTV